MSRDYAEIEREFIADLKARTGKDLAEWMAAIAAERLADKNAIIDWLRPRGFSFAHASWLERIHNNAGRPVYDEAIAREAAEAARKSLKEAGRSEAGSDGEAGPPAPRPAAAGPRPPSEPAAGAPRSPAPPAAQPAAAALDDLLARGKAYRPLAVFLLAEIARAVPGCVAGPRDGYVSIGAPDEFAALDIRSKELRLGLALGELPFAADVQKARLAGAGAHITHMLVLTDARQVDAGLMALVRTAKARIGG